MEEQEILKTEIGEEIKVALKPMIVKILKVSVIPVTIKGKENQKVSCEVKHLDASEPIHISSVKYENKGKLIVSGLWVNLDSKGLIRKDSALAILMNSQKCARIQDLENKEIPTILDDKNFLCFKAY